MQFALPKVVEQLRGGAGQSKTDSGLVVMDACDPANLHGAASEFAPQTTAGAPLSFARLPSSWLVLERGLPALLAHMATFDRHIQVMEWNDEPVLHCAGQPLLEAVGFHREYPGMSWERRG